MIPSWVHNRARWHPRGTRAERGAQAKEYTRKHNNKHLNNPTARPKLLYCLSIWRKENEPNERKRKERDDGKASLTVELDIAIDAKSVRIQSIHALHDTSNDHNHSYYYKCVQCLERPGERPGPAYDWIDSAEHALCIQQVQDKK